MKKLLVLLVIGYITTSVVWADSLKSSKESCVRNLIQREGVCLFVSAGELMGVATEYSFSDVPRGSKSCHLGTTTLESIRNVSLQVFLCDGGSPRLHKFIDPTCYKPIKPGYTLLVTGILKQSARHHLVDEKCYIVKSTESDVIK